MVSISLTASKSVVQTGEVFDMTATLNPNPGSGYTVEFYDIGALPDKEVFRGTTNTYGQVTFALKIGQQGSYSFQALHRALENMPCALAGCVYSNNIEIVATGNDTGGGIDPVEPNPPPEFNSEMLIYGGIALLAIILLTRR